MSANATIPMMLKIVRGHEIGLPSGRDQVIPNGKSSQSTNIVAPIGHVRAPAIQQTTIIAIVQTFVQNTTCIL
jgi:hypothetical protein